jgi:uncharacterized protein
LPAALFAAQPRIHPPPRAAPRGIPRYKLGSLPAPKIDRAPSVVLIVDFAGSMLYACSLMDRSHIVSALAKFPFDSGIAAVYLFGSVAREEATSDIAVAVSYRQLPVQTVAASIFDLQARLRSALGRTVNAIEINRALVDLVHRVLRDGMVVYQADASTRVTFDVQRRNEYFDL